MREDDPLHGSQVAIASWVKSALESWFENKSSVAFLPYQDHFRLNLLPHEVLFSIYGSLSRQGLPRHMGASPASRFRNAIARLLREPEIYRHDYKVYFSLLDLGASIGANEVLDSLILMMNQHKLPPELEVWEGHNSFKVNVLAQSVDTVLRAGFLGSEVVRFLKSTRTYVHADLLSADTIAMALARMDTSRWAFHLADIAGELTRHIEQNAHPSLRIKAKTSFRDRLIAVVGAQNYVNGLSYLKNRGRLRALPWIIKPEFVPTAKTRYTLAPDPSGSALQLALKAARAKIHRMSLADMQT